MILLVVVFSMAFTSYAIFVNLARSCIESSAAPTSEQSRRNHTILYAAACFMKPGKLGFLDSSMAGTFGSKLKDLWFKA